MIAQEGFLPSASFPQSVELHSVAGGEFRADPGRGARFGFEYGW